MMQLKLDQYKPGDVLQISGELRDLVVKEVWLGQTGPWRWIEYMLEPHGGGELQCLQIEEDDGEWVVVHYTSRLRASELGVSEREPFPAKLVYAGRTFIREEKGEARITRLSSLDGSGERTYSVSYGDYSAGEDRLSVETYGGRKQGNPDNNGADGASTEFDIWAGRRHDPRLVRLFANIDTAPRKGLLVSPETDALGVPLTSKESLTVSRNRRSNVAARRDKLRLIQLALLGTGLLLIIVVIMLFAAR